MLSRIIEPVRRYTLSPTLHLGQAWNPCNFPTRIGSAAIASVTFDMIGAFAGKEKAPRQEVGTVAGLLGFRRKRLLAESYFRRKTNSPILRPLQPFSSPCGIRDFAESWKNPEK